MKYFYLIACLLSVAAACKKDAFITDNSGKLDFSTDTVLFDTIFTTVGSTTQQFKVYNKNKKTIRISGIRLAGGMASPFRINVDGLSGTSFTDIEIAGKDSLFIFAEVTIDPTSGTLPFVINDSIVFETNGNIQDVKLVAWGQDAYFFNGSTICDMTWNNDKPYVIYNSILIDSGCTLSINQGVKVYSHNLAGIFVKGTLKVNGTKDEPVAFQADRLESFYEDLPGQWLGVFILRGSVNSTIDHALIKNAFYGLSAGSHDNPDLNSFTFANAPDVLIKHSIIRNMLYTGIFGFLSYIDTENTLVTNCGQHNVHLAFGGSYSFTHVTLSGSGTGSAEHADPALELGNFAESAQGHFSANLDASFTNCIIYGSLDDEYAFDNDNIAQFNYKFENCLLKTTQSTAGIEFVSVIKNQSPLFVDEPLSDYHIKNGSPCVNTGKLTILLDDLEENARDGFPDIGAYEFMP